MTRQVTRQETRQETLRSCHGWAFPRPDAPGRSAARDVQPPSFGDDIDVAWRAGADLQGCVESGHTRGHIQSGVLLSSDAAAAAVAPTPDIAVGGDGVRRTARQRDAHHLAQTADKGWRPAWAPGSDRAAAGDRKATTDIGKYSSPRRRQTARLHRPGPPGRRAAGPVPRLRSCRASKCLARTRRQGQGLEPRDAGHRRRADDGGPGARASGGRGPVAAQCHPPVQGVRLPRCELLRIACVPLNRLGSKSHA